MCTMSGECASWGPPTLSWRIGNVIESESCLDEGRCRRTRTFLTLSFLPENNYGRSNTYSLDLVIYFRCYVCQQSPLKIGVLQINTRLDKSASKSPYKSKNTNISLPKTQRRPTHPAPNLKTAVDLRLSGCIIVWTKDTAYNDIFESSRSLDY